MTVMPSSCQLAVALLESAAPVAEGSASKRLLLRMLKAKASEGALALLHDYYGTTDPEEISLNAAGRRTGGPHAESERNGRPWCQHCGVLDPRVNRHIYIVLHPDCFL